MLNIKFIHILQKKPLYGSFQTSIYNNLRMYCIIKKKSRMFPQKTKTKRSIDGIFTNKRNQIAFQKKQISEIERFWNDRIPDMNELLKMKSSERVQKIAELVWVVSEGIHPSRMKRQLFQHEALLNQLSQEVQLGHIKFVQILKGLSIKQFSITVHKILVGGPKISSVYSKLLWKEIQNHFLEIITPTTNSQLIRSYSKIFYCLTKSKTHRNNPSSTVTTSTSATMMSYETKLAVMLPFASPQSFTMILTGFSRMGPISEQFSYIVERLYYQNKQQFNTRQKVQIMYVLTRNGRQSDQGIIQQIDKMNLLQIITMLRCFQNSNKLFNSQLKYKNKNLLTFAQKHILARKGQMNVIDFGELCKLYFEGTTLKDYDYQLTGQMESMLTENYQALKSNINEVAFMKLWIFLPQMLNAGYLKIVFMEQVLKTMRILRKKNMFPERIWKTIQSTSQEFQNLQLRVKIQKIT